MNQHENKEVENEKDNAQISTTDQGSSKAHENCERQEKDSPIIHTIMDKPLVQQDGNQQILINIAKQFIQTTEKSLSNMKQHENKVENEDNPQNLNPENSTKDEGFSKACQDRERQEKDNTIIHTITESSSSLIEEAKK